MKCEEQSNLKKVISPLRYPGGKSKALKRILPFIPLDFSEYREPFLGGGSVFIALKQLHPDATYRINDLNYDLYCFWNSLKNSVDELINEVMKLRSSIKNGRKLYEKLASSNEDADGFHRAVRFYILNRITYSGTVDSGGYSSEAFEKRFTVTCMDRLKPLSNLLKDVVITHENYENMLLEDGKNVFIYMDPPYWKSMKSKLYGKNGNLHKSFNHKQFATNVEKCKHRWLATCDNSKKMRNLLRFANTYTYPWEMQYGMNNVKNKRAGKGQELFIMNYKPNL